MKLCGLVPTFCIHISVSDLYIPKISPPTLLFAFVDRSWDYIHRSQIHECRNWERGRAVSFLGIFVSNFQYSVFAVHVNRLTIGSIPELGSSSPPCSWTQNVCGWNVQTGCCSGIRSIFIYVLKISDPDPLRVLTVPDPRIRNPELYVKPMTYRTNGSSTLFFFIHHAWTTESQDGKFLKNSFTLTLQRLPNLP